MIEKNGTVTANTVGIEIAEPVCVQEQVLGRRANSDGTYTRVYEARKDGKSGTLTRTMRQNAVALPVNETTNGKSRCLRSTCYKDGIRNIVGNNVDRKTGVAEPVESQTVIGAIPQIVNKYGYLPEMFNAYNRSKITDKAPTLSTGSMVTSSCAVNRMEEIYCYAEPCEWDKNGIPTKATSGADGKTYNVYQVLNGQITIKDKTYPIKLIDGYYIIRKLTVGECKRLQTVPEWFDFSCVSNTQAYKMLGNGWTVEVIMHLINSCLNLIK